MRIEDYTKMKLAEVDYFLRGINFYNLVKNSNDCDKKSFGIPCSELINIIDVDGGNFDARFINRRRWYELLVNAVSEIRSLRYRLECVDLDIGVYASTQVDDAVEEFISKVMIIVEQLKADILEDVRIKDKVQVNKSFESSSLEFLKIRLGAKVFDWKKSSKKNQNGVRGKVRNSEIVDSLVVILAYVHLLPDMIKTSQELRGKMISFLQKLESCKIFELGSEKHMKLSKYSFEVCRSKNYDVALKEFEKVVKLLEEAVTNFWDEYDNAGDVDEKYDKLLALYRAAKMLVPEDKNDDVKHTK